MLTEADIREALRACYDPATPYEQPIDIVDLGLVEDIILAPDPDAPGANIPGVPPRQSLILTLIPANRDNDAQSQLQRADLNRLAGLPRLSRTTVEFAESPAWTPARISPAARRRLNLDFPILNNRRQHTPAG